MYKKHLQLSFDDFVFPYGRLNPENRWVKLADIIDWDSVEDEYAKGFTDNGAPAHPARMALGSLIAKQMLGCSDKELTMQIAENPYLQRFIGLKEFQESCPFGASTLVAFRKRFSEEDIMRINDRIIKDAEDDGGDDDSAGGTLIVDATVAPSDITYPQDVKLLNEARVKLEGIIDDLCLQTGVRRPRTYRQNARRDFLNWSKSRRRGAGQTRKAIRRQLGYVRRDLGYIEGLTGKHNALMSRRQEELMTTIRTVFAQQQYMYESRTHSVPGRIISIAQPWVRPIVRGKANANTEFGAKVHTSIDGGFSRIEDLSFDAYNEADRLIDAIEAYNERNGHYPSRVLADKIYRNRKNLNWCKERDIKISGPRLGRPPKDTTLMKADMVQERKDASERNEVEGSYGTMKTAYGMDPVKARLEETTRTVIALSVLVFNLKKRLNASLALILEWLNKLLANQEGMFAAAA